MNKLKSLIFSRWSLAIIILIIAVFLRLYNITQLPPGLYPDEAMNGNNALEALSDANGGFKVFYPENNGREGLFINVQAIFLKVLMPLAGGNPEPWMLRIPSALFGVLTVLGLYFLTKQLFKRPVWFEKNVSEAERARLAAESGQSEAESQAASERLGERDRVFSQINPGAIALLSSFLLATSFWHINFSRIGFRAIMAPMFLVWGIYFLLLSLNKDKLKTVLFSVIGGAIYGLGFYSYIAYRATPLLILIILFLYWIKAKRETGAKPALKRILLVACLVSLVAFIVAAPLGLYFLHNPQDFFGRTSEISIFDSPSPLKTLGTNVLKTAGMFNFAGDWNWRHNFAGRPELFWPVGIVFLIGVFGGLRIFFLKVSRRLTCPPTASPSGDGGRGGESFSFIILFAWLIIAALPVVVSNEGLPHALRAILMIPPIFILAGVGAFWLYEKLIIKIQNSKKFVKIILFSTFYIILSLLILEAYTTYFVTWGRNPNVYGAFSADYVQIGREINALPEQTPKYVVVEASGTDVRGIPMPAQTVMFITDTFPLEKRLEKNVHYVLPNQTNQIPENAYVGILK